MSGLRALLISTAIAAVLSTGAALVVRALPLSNLVGLLVAVASPYTALLAALGFVLAAVCRRILLCIVAAVLLVTTLTTQVPWYYFGEPVNVGQHAVIRVLSSNLRKGQADAASFVRLAENSADVITVAELTPEEVNRFSHNGIDATFPYSVLAAAPGAAGMGLWSRFPLTAMSPSEPSDTGMVVARLRVPNVRYNPVVASVHIVSPVASDHDAFTYWRSGIDSTKRELTAFADAAGPAAIIIGGDFNSTPDMRQFRDLLTNGYRDAVQQTGAGFAPTFPSNRRFVPPLITIDHVLTRSAAASSVTTVKIPGSDHRSLLATVQVPLDPTAS